VTVFSKFKKPIKGFTLSELLISLGVLGLIAALAIPSVWASLKESQDRALLRTAIRTLSEASSRLANEPPTLTAPNNTTWHVFDTALNSADDNFVAVGSPDNSFTMPGGGVLSGFNNNVALGAETIILDVNGTVGPNRVGRDQLGLTVCFNPTGTCPAAGFTVNGLAQEAGIVGPMPDAWFGGTGNVAFYNTIISTT
jgi:prepilin-type N-terminal cleavage/methylation domain-containing protein